MNGGYGSRSDIRYGRASTGITQIRDACMKYYCITMTVCVICFFFSSRRRHTRYIGDWSSDVCSSDLTIGRQEPLKLLLNQKDPALAGRIFAYYGYFGRARAGQIRLIEEDGQRSAELEGQLDAEDQQLAELERQQRAQLHQLEVSRVERSHVLASLEAQSHTRAQSLERLRSQQAGLEKLLRELRAAVERFPIEGNDVFTRLRGKLAWPVSGRVVARFGDARAGGVHWDGGLVATERGAPVKAGCQGRVIYADWLPGLGLLTIVDHGDGYLSLYGHNERLYKAVGEPVTAGEPLAAAGDSGGSSRPELYFEIRKGGKPVDPRPWFRAADP